MLRIGGILLGCVAAVMVVGWGLSQKTIRRQKDEINQLREQVSRLKADMALRKSEERGFEKVPPEKLELLRLRGEVTSLRGELNQAQTQKNLMHGMFSMISTQGDFIIKTQSVYAADDIFQSKTRAVQPGDEQARATLVEKERQLKQWWKAFLSYAESHDGDLPISFAEAEPYLPAGFRSTLDVDNFQRPSPEANRYNLHKLQNSRTTVFLKEKIPLQLPDGIPCNLWLFTDGSIRYFRD